MKKFILVIAVVALAAIAWLWYAGKLPWFGAQKIAPEAEVGFGGSLYNQVAAENPVAKLPETNPFKAEINPFAGVYKNPFGQ